MKRKNSPLVEVDGVLWDTRDPLWFDDMIILNDIIRKRQEAAKEASRG